MTTYSGWSQKTLKQGYVKMTLTDIKSSDSEMAPMLEVMKGSTNEIYFDEQKQKVEINMMSGMMLMRIYQNIGGKTSETYMDMMGQKKSDSSPYTVVSSDGDTLVLESEKDGQKERVTVRVMGDRLEFQSGDDKFTLKRK